MTAKIKKKFKIVKSVIEYLLLAFLILILLFVVLMRIQGRTPTFFGYRFYTVVSGSMEPELKINDVILSKTAKPDKLKVGDNVTYIGQKGTIKDMRITHKIESISIRDGKTYVVTKGVANDSSDPEIDAAIIEAVMSKKLKAVSAFVKFAGTVYGFILIIVLPLSAILVLQVISMVKRKTVPAKENETEPPAA